MNKASKGRIAYWSWDMHGSPGSSPFAIPYEQLPPDLLSAERPPCGDKWDTGAFLWHCTRTQGHTGRHAGGDGDRIVAVWS